ncbi:hypothetical protein EXIGLDRAFT_737198 [Exidia glandulosa HHB12029]|uniref:Uncharacterized protein n=1 Tax=Exidia glandulosa HHB12029 TaxID=1314781 RepID=A0A165J4K5_EXIGL|nr:hypothetical protein EXIGLDRAFT_737198 [Exidia glandulosa HHB12029]
MPKDVNWDTPIMLQPRDTPSASAVSRTLFKFAAKLDVHSPDAVGQNLVLPW